MRLSPERALARAQAKDPEATQFVVRLWDGFDGEWMDVSGPCDSEKAKQEWSKRTKGGTENTSYGDIDYYAIYPTTVRMRFSDGRSMTRGA